MARHRHALPQLNGGLFLTDGGIETTLIFHDGLSLPYFAAFDLFKDQKGREALDRYFRSYATIARDHGVNLILESATWRASPDWGAKLGYSPEALAGTNRAAIEQLVRIRSEFETEGTTVLISGCIGPRGDGYDPGAAMTPDDAQRYHSVQAGIFAGTEADLITAITMTNVEEAIGLTRAAEAAGMPVVISFTVETDGTLPTGQPLGEAIGAVDRATDRYPAYFMINCAHPTHFDTVLRSGAQWVARIHGIRANASAKSHAELNDSTELDAGNPAELGRQYRDLAGRHRQLNVFGGCCGTDSRHMLQVCEACAPLFT